MFEKMVKRNSWGLSLLFITLWTLLTMIYHSGFAGASGDDFFRALMSYEWSQSPFFISKSFQYCSIHWFPTHFWIAGAMIQLTQNLTLSLTSLSILFYFIELFLLFKITKLLFNTLHAYLSVLLVGFLPWYLWLGLSMTEMTMYFVSITGAFLFFIKWQNENRTSHLCMASLFFLFATMFRPESWIFSALFSAYLLIFLVQNRRTSFSRLPVIVSMILPNLFILFWLTYNIKEFGNPIYFLTTVKSVVQNYLDFHSVPSWIKGLQFPFLIFIVSPFLSIFILIGLGGYYRSLKKVQKTYIRFILAQLAFLVLATLYGLGTTAAPQRYVLISVILLTPFAAHGLSHLWQKKYGVILVISILFIYIGLSFFKSFFYSTQYKDVVKAGKYLKDHFESGFISPSEQMSSELAFRRITGQLLATQQDFINQSSAHAALAVYSGRPRNFLFNILETKEKEMLRDEQSADEDSNTKMISLNHSTIASKLKGMQVAKIILRDRELMDWIPHDFHLEKTIGHYAIFSSNLPTPPLPSNETGFNKGMNFLKQNLGKGIVLRGYRYEGSIFPDSLSLLWKLDEKYDPRNTYKMKMRFLSLKNPEKKFVRVISPIFQWYKIDKLSEGILVGDNISLFLPVDMPNGEYSLKISLMEQVPDTIPPKNDSLSGEELTLGSLTLISSKREVLRDVLRGEGFNWKLLMKTLVIS